MAVYNNGFPMNYSQMYPTYSPISAQSVTPVQTVPQNGLIWVQGEAGAKSYLVAPNSTVQLWDSESQTVYLKSADATGMPSIKILDYTIRDSNKNPANTVPVAQDDKSSVFATKDEIRAVYEQITALRDRVDSLTKQKGREKDE